MRGTQDEAAVDAIGDIAAGKREERDRHEHREAGVGEHHRIAGAVVEIPADRYRLDLQREAGAEAAREEEDEVADYCFGIFAVSTTFAQRCASAR